MDSETCRYDARHQSQNVPAVTTIDGGAVVGLVPACRECADADRLERNHRMALRQGRNGELGDAVPETVHDREHGHD